MAGDAYQHAYDVPEAFPDDGLDTWGELAPEDRQSELAVICGMLQNPALIPEALSTLKAEYFGQAATQAVFRAILECVRNDVPVCPVSLYDVMIHTQSRDMPHGAGVGFLNDLFTKSPDAVVTKSNFAYWLDKVRTTAIRRALWEEGHHLIESAFDPGNKTLLEDTQARLMTIAEAHAAPEANGGTSGMIQEALADIGEALNNPTGITGIASGFRSLDTKTRGFQPGALNILAARSGTGKTALAVNIACHVVHGLEKPVLFFSLEMTGKELMARVIRQVAGSSTDLQRMQDATGIIEAHRHLWIVEDDPGMTISAIQARTQRELHRHGELGLIVVDYLGKVKPEGEASRFNNRAYELEAVTWGLKSMAKRLKLPVLALCQLNRAIEGRQSKKPMLSDLRDSGAIEQDADVVLFLSPQEGQTAMVDLTIAKHRNGPLGEIPLAFLGHLTQFREVPGQ
ncbi:MAG: replicative DNA helicase [Candidatus Melainabacteria bacterium]